MRRPWHLTALRRRSTTSTAGTGQTQENAIVVAGEAINVAERDDRRSLATLVKHLRGAAGGLDNLRATYADDVGTVARISAMIDSLDQGLTHLELEPFNEHK